GCNERRLAGVWKANQPNVGEQFQFKPQGPFFTRSSGSAFRRHSVDGSGKVAVGFPASPPLSDDDRLAICDEIRKSFFRQVIIDDGADRNSDGQIFAGTARAIGSSTGSPVLSCIMILVAEIE